MTLPSQIFFTWGSFSNNGNHYGLDAAQSTTDSKFYEWVDSNGSVIGGANYGIEFRKHADGSTWVYANTGGNNNDPTTLGINGANYSSSIQITSTNVTNGDYVQGSNNRFRFNINTNMLFPSGPTVTYGPSHGALPTSTGFTVYNLNFTKVGDREYRISYQQKNAPPNSYTVRISHTISNGSYQNTDYTVTTAASGQTINLKSGSLYGTGPQAGTITPQNNSNLTIRFMDFNAKLGSAGATIGQGLIFNTWTYLYNNLTATFTPSSGVPGTVFNFTLTGSDDSYASSNTATLTNPSGTVTTFTKNAEGQFHDSVTNVTSIEGDYTVEHPTGVNRGTSTYDNSGPPIVETTSNGGRKRRYPIISTNLFDRQRSIYSIGNTHKDETLF